MSNTTNTIPEQVDCESCKDQFKVTSMSISVATPVTCGTIYIVCLVILAGEKKGRRQSPQREILAHSTEV